MNTSNRDEISSALLCGEVHHFSEISSTNEYLLQHARHIPCGSICLADSQTAGRGRRGRTWYSPPGQNLYLSLLWKYSTLPAQLSTLSLLVALVLADSLRELGVTDIQLKWPNDIYYKHKKAGGILIETQCHHNGIEVVIGIGLNLAMTRVDPTVVTQAWTDLSSFQLERERLISHFAPKLQRMLRDFPTLPLSEYLSKWREFDCFYQKPVKLLMQNREIAGIVQGIDLHTGELLLQADEKTHAFAIGEISLRATEPEAV